MNDEAQGAAAGSIKDEEQELRRSLDEVLGSQRASDLRSGFSDGPLSAASMRADLFDAVGREVDADLSSLTGLTSLRAQSASRRLALVMSMVALVLLGTVLRQWLGEGLSMAPARVWLNTGVVLSLVFVGLWSAL